MATITATSASKAAVETAISSAVAGDTVIIPATTGSIWGGLNLNKAITLQGAGTTSGSSLTRITNGGGGTGMLNVSLFSGQASQNLRITGIAFDCLNWANPGSTAINFGYNTKVLSFRIDHCTFNLGTRVIYLSGWNAGVIDHCTLTNPNIGVAPSQVFSPESRDGQTSWNRTVAPGTSDAVFVEDCTAIWNASCPADPNEFLYGWWGGRAVMRHCALDGSAMNRPMLAVDAHGPVGTSDSTCMYEVYENMFHAKQTYRFCHLRGGRHLFWNNTFINDGGGTTAFDLIQEIFGNPTVSPADLAAQQIASSYFWNNTLNGATANITSSDGRVVLNRDYWTHTPQSGQVFYPYTPYTYPHPLISGAVAPIISVSPASIDFGSVAVGSSPADQSIQVTNIGTVTVNGVVTKTGSSAFTIFSGGTYNLAPGISQATTVRYRPTTKANESATLTFSGGSGATVQVSGIAYPLLNSPFTADAGIIIAPFTVSNGTVSQPNETISPIAGGRASYGITIPVTGNYTVSALVQAPDVGSNSFFINFDSNPTDPAMVWDIVPLTNGIESRIATWRGNSTTATPQFSPKTWALTAGVHELIIRGREANVVLSTITVTSDAPVIPPAPTAPGSPSPADNATGVLIGAALTWAEATANCQFNLSLSTSNPPSQVASNLSSASYTPPAVLTYATTYYWKVTAFQNWTSSGQSGVVSTDGPIWSFTTEASPPAPNIPPTVALTSPVEGTIYAENATVNLAATATDSDGTVSKVEFYQNGVKIVGSDDTTAPYAFAWTSVASGNYTLTAKATDNNSNVGTSPPINIHVMAAGTAVVPRFIFVTL